MKKNNDDMYIFPAEPPKPASKPLPPKPGEKFNKLPDNNVWFTHDPAIYHDPVSNNYYVYGTGANCLKSQDLISFTSLGRVVEEPPSESVEWVGDKAIWAPDIVKVGDEYRLYCSNSTWGVRQSCIFLAVSDNAEGPFIPRGCVIKTSEKLPVNAIDANIIADHKTGEQYMVYGSFWGGCHIIRINTQTGLAAEEGIGRCVARRPKWADCAIEGPYIIYNDRTDYYYLFVSYASLQSDYNIRVGRSVNPYGPFYDINGRDMTDLEDYDNSLGYMIAAGYSFKGCTEYMGPGHNSVLHDNDDNWYLVSHIREKNFKGGEPSTMHIRKIVWSSDGWPCASPCQYAGEISRFINEPLIIGNYEYMKLTPSIPQGISLSVPLSLYKDHSLTISDSIIGHWSIDRNNRLILSYGTEVDELNVLPAWDYDKWTKAIVFTGISNKGIAIWGKRDM